MVEGTGKGKGIVSPDPGENEPDSPTPDFANVTDIADVADAADAAEYSIAISEPAADGNQAAIPLLVPVDDSIPPNPAGGPPVDAYTGLQTANSSDSLYPWVSNNMTDACVSPASGDPGRPTNYGGPSFGDQSVGSQATPIHAANPFSPPIDFITENWQNLIAQAWDPAGSPGPPPPVGPGLTVTDTGGVTFTLAPGRTTEGGWSPPAQPDQPAPPAPPAPPVPDQPLPPIPPAPLNLDQVPSAGDVGVGPTRLPPISPGPPSPLPPNFPPNAQLAQSMERWLGYWSSLPSSTLPPGAQFTPPPLPPMPPGATFYGGQVQWPSPAPPPSSAPPAELAGLIGFIPPTGKYDVIPYLTTVTDTGSTVLNSIEAFLYGWENVARSLVNAVLGWLTALNQTLEQNGIYPQAIPIEAAPMFVAESLQYFMGRAGQSFSSFAVSPNSPTWWFMGAGGLGGGRSLGPLPSTAVESTLGPLAQEAVPSAAQRAANLLQIVNPHFVPTTTEAVAFQGFTENVAARLQLNPGLFSSYLSSGEQAFTARGLWAERIKFGNAVERAMAEASAPSGFLIHTGEIRPFKLGGADFVGAPGTPFEGLQFQVTSVGSFESHFLNSPEGTIFGIYPQYTRPLPSP